MAKQIRITEDIIWEDTGQIEIHPAQSVRQYSFMWRVYKEFNRNTIGSKQVPGPTFYEQDMTAEQRALYRIIVEAQKALLATLPHPKGIDE